MAMNRIYVSSTREDLEEYRRAVVDVLTSCGYGVDAMERYAARDDRPRSACEADVTRCDAYVGIFAWRYGHVPAEDNVERKSITELEYLAAEKAGIPRFIFLAADDVAWPSTMRDGEQEDIRRIGDFRTRLERDRWVAFFRSPEDLAKQALVSMVQHDATKRAQSLSAIDDIATRTYEMGYSFLPDIRNRLESIGPTEFAVLRLGPTPWWNTRLHLVAALASDFTEIRQFVLMDQEDRPSPDPLVGRFLTMTAPLELRRALAKTFPKLELAYLQSREGGAKYDASVDRIVFCYPEAVKEVFGAPETSVKQAITPTGLREVPVKPQGEVVELADRPPLLVSAEIVRRPTPYVALTRAGKLVGVVDRAEFASRLANVALQGSLSSTPS